MSEDQTEKLAAWMIAKSFATGHGDTLEDLLRELGRQLAEKEARTQRLERLQSLLARAADALEEWNYIDGHSVRNLHVYDLIQELRKAG